MAATLQAFRAVGIVGRITLLEAARRQALYVLLLLALALIGGAVSLASFDAHVQRKVLADACFAVIFVVSSLITVTLMVSLLPAEAEQRTVYPVIAKAVPRWQFVLGKYVGAMGAVAVALTVMGGVFAGLEVAYIHQVDAALFCVVAFLFLQAAVLGAVALWLSTFCTWPLAWFLTLLVGLLGSVKASLYDSLMAQHQPVWNRATITAINALLPDLSAFNFKEALVHHLFVSNGTLAQSVAYALCYTWAALGLAMYSFARREL